MVRGVGVCALSRLIPKICQLWAALHRAPAQSGVWFPSDLPNLAVRQWWKQARSAMAHSCITRLCYCTLLGSNSARDSWQLACRPCGWERTRPQQGGSKMVSWSIETGCGPTSMGQTADTYLTWPSSVRQPTRGSCESTLRDGAVNQPDHVNRTCHSNAGMYEGPEHVAAEGGAKTG
jgi:hypothetical protein